MKSVVLAFVLSVCAALSAQAQSGYQIRPGDVLAVEVLQDPSLNREVLVLPDGSISFPFAGNLPASGRTTSQVQDLIAQGIAPNFAVVPNVFVTVRQLRPPPLLAAGQQPLEPTIDIYVLGEVGNPGLIAVPPGSTFLQALALGNGFTNFAAQRRIQLRRTDPRTGQSSVTVFDYRAISDGAALLNDPVLSDGDVILVPERRLFE